MDYRFPGGAGQYGPPPIGTGTVAIGYPSLNETLPSQAEAQGPFGGASSAALIAAKRPMAAVYSDLRRPCLIQCQTGFLAKHDSNWLAPTGPSPSFDASFADLQEAAALYR